MEVLYYMIETAAGDQKFLLSEHLYNIKKKRNKKQNRLYITALEFDQIRC